MTSSSTWTTTARVGRPPSPCHEMTAASGGSLCITAWMAGNCARPGREHRRAGLRTGLPDTPPIRRCRTQGHMGDARRPEPDEHRRHDRLTVREIDHVSKRVCAGPGQGRCPTAALIPKDQRRCPHCARAYERARGSSRERGYGSDHRATREAWQSRIDAGDAISCWRCGVLLIGTAWHLDHTDDRTGYHGPACIACNLSAAGKAAHRN